MIMQSEEILPIGPILTGNMWDHTNQIWRLVKVILLKKSNEKEYRNFCASIDAPICEDRVLGSYYYECQVLD